MSEIELKQQQDELIRRIRMGEISFIDAAEQTDAISSGAILYKDEARFELVGVPFSILGGTYRDSLTREVFGKKVKGDYVSLEIMVGDEAALKRNRVDMDKVLFRPLDIIRLNDGGTGIRRQITSYLAQRGYITLDATAQEDWKTGGPVGECHFDIPVSEWMEYHVGDVKYDDETHDTVYDFIVPKMLIAPRGLRPSSYKNDFGDSTTFYLA